MSSKPIIQHFTDDILAVIDKYKGEGITVGETVGALEIIKYGVIENQIEDEGEF